MLGTSSSQTDPRFSVFEVEVRARELRKKDSRVKLQQQPFELLPAVATLQMKFLKKQANRNYVSPEVLAYYHTRLGQQEQTLDQLEEAYRQHSPGLLDVQNTPEYDFLHGDPRYRSIIQRVGLPPEY